jgi:hypothetical protein
MLHGFLPLGCHGYGAAHVENHPEMDDELNTLSQFLGPSQRAKKEL